MGVPAFFKWLSTKYPKIILDCVEDRATWTPDGKKVPVDTSLPNPNGVEFECAAGPIFFSARAPHVRLGRKR